MKANYVANAAIDALLDPASGVWRASEPRTISLTGTPASMQPTESIRVSWMGKETGAVANVIVKALHNGEVLAFRLEWEDATENTDLVDNDSFPDAAAIALPAHEDAPLILMGAPGKPVNAWYWRADVPERARQVAAEGLGTSRTLDQSVVSARGHWKEGRWRVVIARPLRTADVVGAAQLAVGQETGFGVAIWEGSNMERGGIKAFSGNWVPLTLENVPSGGRS
jgi:DMSO reductase family type II enzyme heme b subunit